MTITFDKQIGSGATEWWGNIIISNIQATEKIKQFIAIGVLLPAELDAKNIQVSFNDWISFTVEDVKNDAIANNLYLSSCRITFTTGLAISDIQSITMGVGGDLTKQPNKFLDSIQIKIDHDIAMNGKLKINCAPAPDAALKNAVLQLTATQGQIHKATTITLGSINQKKLPIGHYTLSAPPLTNSAKTVIAPVVINPSSVDITLDTSANTKISFGTVAHYCTVDFTVANIPELENLALKVTLTAPEQKPTIFTAETGKTYRLTHLPANGTLGISVDPIYDNNRKISFEPIQHTLKNDVLHLTLSRASVHINPIDTKNFSELDITVKTAKEFAGHALAVHLSSPTMNYHGNLSVQNQTVRFPSDTMKVQPGKYQLTIANFIMDKVVYVVNAPETITIQQAPTTIEVAIETSAKLTIPGFPDFLSFGGCANLQPANADDFTYAKANTIFKYAGNDGGGDADTFLAKDIATENTIKMARIVEKNLLNKTTVLPLMISYTANLSGGDPSNLQDHDKLMHSYANFILSLQTARNHIDTTHPTPAAFIVNPDFIGFCQQQKLTANHKMPVQKPLQDALKHWEITTAIPHSITDDLKGYVHSVNWLAHTIAPEVSFGWQINLWGVGSAQWIYGNKSDLDYKTVAKKISDYIKSLDVFSQDNTPHFMAIDRYERDDFTQDAYINTYCYSPKEWEIFYQFCGEISKQLGQAVMPWQIPASRIPIEGVDSVKSDFGTSQHWGTQANWLFGDADFAGNINKMNKTVREFKFPAQMAAQGGATPEDLFKRAEPFDLSLPAYTDFPLRGIFSIQLGGGSTTGIISAVGNPDNWVRNKLRNYAAQPIPFIDTLKKL